MYKKAVLVIHGFGDSIRETEKFINYLKYNSNFDVYGYTLPGHETIILKNVKYTEWIDESEKNIEKLIKKYKTIYVVGHSMGGVIASYLATKHKEIKKIVLIAPSFIYGNIEQNKDDLKKMLSNKKYKEKYKEEIYDDLLSKIFRVPVTSIFEFSKMVKKYFQVPFKIYCETLILHGNEDEVIPVSSSVYVYNSVPCKEKTITIVKDVKHRMLLSNKEEEISKYINIYFKGGLKWKISKKSEI